MLPRWPPHLGDVKGRVSNRVPNSADLTTRSRTEPNKKPTKPAQQPCKSSTSKPAGPGSPRVGRFDSFAAPWGHLQGLLAPSGFETTTNGAPTPRRGPSSLARHRVQRIWPNRAAPRQRFGVRGAVFDALAPGGRNRLGHGDTRGTRWQPRPRDSCAGSRVRRPRRREALPLAPRLRAAVAAVRSHRRPHGLGGPRPAGRSRTRASRACRRWSASTRRRGRCCCTPRWAARGCSSSAPIAAGRGSVGGRGRRPHPGGDGRFAAFTAALAIVAGIAALVAGLLRLGFLANFISQPVLKGFIIGLALTIIIGQVPKLFGLDPTRGDFFEQAWRLIAHLGDTQGLTLLVGALSLAVVIGLRRLAPGVPGLARGGRRAPSPRSRCSTSTCPRSGRSRAGCRRSGCPTSDSVTPGGWPRPASA